MIIEHDAIDKRPGKVERILHQIFGAVSNDKYINASKNFESYFLSFDTGARLEIMKMKGIPLNTNDTVDKQHLGIIHLAFGVNEIQEVDKKALELKKAGYPILAGPRKTGDEYYEFETLDPDKNRIEVTAPYLKNKWPHKKMCGYFS